ncbi:MAG: saccharopine dehydrogenase, partial [Phenylobacterium sp.]
YDILFVGIAADGRKVRVSVKGDRDPGYGSTSKMMAETAIQLIRTPATPGGVWTPGAALGLPLVERLQARAGLAFTDETA